MKIKRDYYLNQLIYRKHNGFIKNNQRYPPMRQILPFD